MILRSGRIANNSQPITNRKNAKKMVNTTSQGEQFPPQGTSTIGANSIDVSTEIPNAQAIPTSGSMALNNSTTMPIMSSVADISANSTPRPPGFENFRPLREYPYGMPSTAMAGL